MSVLVAAFALSGCVNRFAEVEAALAKETEALTAALSEAYAAGDVLRSLDDLPREVWPAGLEPRPVGEKTTLYTFRALLAPYLFVSGPLTGLRLSYDIKSGRYLGLSVPTGPNSSCSWYVLNPEWRCGGYL